MFNDDEGENYWGFPRFGSTYRIAAAILGVILQQHCANELLDQPPTHLPPPPPPPRIFGEWRK